MSHLTLELIVNVLLLAFGIFCYFYVGATMPASDPLELGAEQWPQAVLFLMFLALAYNIFRIIKTNRANGISFGFGGIAKETVGFFKSKLFVAMVIVMVMALVLEYLGFLFTCFLFMVAYGLLLGERRIPVLILSALGITLILYIGFSVFLGVMLPRGYGIFRTITLAVEGIIPTF